MVEKLKNKIKGRLKGQGGFTLIELIIVIGIMGFLIAMIAPRLAGVMGGASDTVCDTNQTRLQEVMAVYTENYDVMPNGLLNLVIKTGALHDAIVPLSNITDDGDKGTGLEVFSGDFIDGMNAAYVALTAEEAEELKKMGISRVHNLNLGTDIREYNGYRTEGSWNTTTSGLPAVADGGFMDSQDVETGVRVLMYGMGATAAGHELNQADLYGRIILGVGPDSDLVQDGLINKAGMCPNALKRNDFFVYNNYNIAVPRLQDTVTYRISPTLTFTDANNNTTLTAADLEAQEPWQFTTLCPEGDTIAGTAGDWSVTTP